MQRIPTPTETLRRAELVAARFALREAGNLLRAAAPLVHQAGDKLQALSQHPRFQGAPPSFDF